MFGSAGMSSLSRESIVNRNGYPAARDAGASASRSVL